MRKVLTFATLLVVVGTLNVPGFAQNTNREGPFGLTWGSTVAQTKAAGIELKDETNKENGLRVRPGTSSRIA